MAIKHRSMQMQIKSLAEDGTFEGILSPYGNVDQGGDMVERGAFTKFLAQHGNVVPLLWQHKADCPIGELTLDDRTDGLYCSGKFLLEQDSAGNYLVPDAAKAYSLLKARVIKGLSIGYEAIKAQTIAGVRHLKELMLYEGSVVTFPMNQSAGVNSVKHRQQKGGFADSLGENQLRSAASQMLSSLSDALIPLPWSGTSRDEILSAAQTSLDEFSAAYMEYLPTYLDYLQNEYGIDTKLWKDKREVKEGRKISADTRASLTAAHEHVKSAFDALDDLLCEEDPEEADCDLEQKSHAEAISSMFSLLR